MLRAVAPLVMLASALALAADPEVPNAEQAQEAARSFGRALTQADVSILRPLLPARGRVRLRLVRLAGPEEGSYSPGQVETLIADFLGRASVQSYEVVRDEGSGDGYALVHGLVRLTGPEGHSEEIHVHLAFEPEQGHWILREIRETPP